MAWLISKRNIVRRQIIDRGAKQRQHVPNQSESGRAQALNPDIAIAMDVVAVAPAAIAGACPKYANKSKYQRVLSADGPPPTDQHQGAKRAQRQ